MIGIFDIFKIGIGPSSSHTMAPMKAARLFLEEVESLDRFDEVAEVRVELFGSLALTGKGHATDTAILLGLSGETAEGVEIERIPDIVGTIRATGRLTLMGRREIAFREPEHLVFDCEQNPFSFSSAVRFTASDAELRPLHDQVYFSLGGGFVVRARDWAGSEDNARPTEIALPHPFDSGADLLRICEETGLSIADIVLRNERVRMSYAEIDEGLQRIWRVMTESIEHALDRDGLLPGPLMVRRRAPALRKRLLAQEPGGNADSLRALDWINLFAIAVNEESASGGRVVTAPTNGAAGIIPAVATYYFRFVPGADEAGVFRLLATAAAIGMIYKKNASFAASEVGCQGEVGVACSMAAAGLVAALGGTDQQAEMAAEIGMEHNLGLTCDPVGGFVQIPCIERNAIGAVKAVDAARLALSSDGRHHVSLDAVIKTMWETGKDMQDKYKDTGKGGLAVNVPLC